MDTTPGLRQPVSMRLKEYWVVGVVVAFSLGLGTGWLTSGVGPGVREPIQAEVHSPASITDARAQGFGGQAKPGSKAAQSEVLDALIDKAGDDPRADLIRTLARFSSDPARVLGVIIDTMSDRELTASISSLTDIAPEKVKESGDSKAYARRLAELAMEGLLQVQGTEGPILKNVTFSEEGAGAAEEPTRLTNFSGDGRILATFPMGDYGRDEVFVKWTRVDDPKIMLFNHYPIKSDAETNYVWMRPKEGWDPGEYRVDFYTADDSLTPIAGGWYVIDPAHGGH